MCLSSDGYCTIYDKPFIAILLLVVSDEDKMLKFISLWEITLHKCVYHKMGTAQRQSNYCSTLASR